MFFIFCGLLLLLSLWTYDVKDPTLNQSISGVYEIQNAVGPIGAGLAGFLVDLFGLASYVWALFFIGMGAGLVSKWFVVAWYRWIGYLLLAVCFLSLTEAWGLGIRQVQGGGFTGSWVYLTGHKIFSPTGSSLVWLFALLVGLELSFKISWLGLLHKAFGAGKARVKKLPKVSLPRPSLPALRSQPDKSPKKEPKVSAKAAPPGLDIIMPKPEPVKSAPAPKPDKKPRPGKPDKKARPEDPDSLPLPALDLFSPLPKNAVDSRPDPAVLESKGVNLMECLQNFGVQAKLAKITPGPVVTMFEVRPDPGVKASRIAGLAPDLAMSLKAVAVRIQAPIPGTDTVGVEIPNDKRAMVYFREVLAHPDFQEAGSLLSMALGKDISGKPFSADLAKMPHLLVAGATGTGKSVCLNSIIISLLCKAGPDQVQLLMIDPKRVELAMYADLPHLVHPVVTEMELAKNALLWAMDEMNRRYTLFSQAGVRNITGYNEKIAKLPDPVPEDMQGLEPLPFMVIVVDELADLMMSRGKEVETCIVRLAQLARAAGIHLIIATQRPSVDVVTGLIKANFPCRISFQVTSLHDSRTILDQAGAEALLGKGDMLFKPSGGKLMRLHGAYVSDEEVRKVVEHWKHLRQPQYKIDFSQMEPEGSLSGLDGPGGNDVVDDPIYVEAVQFVREQGKVSISQLQRRFRVGFNRAARYVEQMERDGVVTPADSTKPRTVVR